MGSEIFRLKSLGLDDTVVRGARVNLKNARTTSTVEVNPGEEAIVKSGETGINKEYLIQSSLTANNLAGYGTFTNNSKIVTGYTGPQNLNPSDLIRLEGDRTFYTVTGIQGTDIYLIEKYIKEDTKDPNVQTGPCTLRKTKLDSVNYELVENEDGNPNLYYNREDADWKYTGMQPSGPYIAPSDEFELDTGINIQFKSGSQNSKPDLMTVDNAYKVILDNNTSEISDLSLSPIPYPHESLQVYVGKGGSAVEKKEEGTDYVVNYSQNPDFEFPRPPLEDRKVAYLKFLDRITDEPQVIIDSDFDGNINIIKKSDLPGAQDLPRPVKDIIPSRGFDLKIGVTSLENNKEYIVDYDAGLVNLVEHVNSENIVESILYTKRLIWDGISVIRGVEENEVRDFNNLVVPGVTGLEGSTGVTYYEDTDENNLIRNVDYNLDFESGTISFTSRLNSGESVLVSYFVEGEDVENEEIDLNYLRAKKYPIIVSSASIVQKFKRTNSDGSVETDQRILVEGEDFDLSYLTGRIKLYELGSADEEITSMFMSYTPMAQVNCVLQSDPEDDLSYRMMIIDDILTVFNPENLQFKIENNVVSIPSEDPFKDKSDESRWSFEGSIIENSLQSIKIESTGESFDINDYTYDNFTKELKLDNNINSARERPGSDDIILATYAFNSEILPYAPVQVVLPRFSEGDSSFVIEGFDRTDVLKPDQILRIDNFNPEATYYFKIKSVVYSNGNTTVSLYSSFPENIYNPVFYLFDNYINFNSLPSGTSVETAALAGSEAIVFYGNPAQLSSDIKQGTLIIVNDSDIYTAQSIEISGDTTIVGISPSLVNSMSNNVKYSGSVPYNEGDTTLSPEFFVTQDPQQPAFTLIYNAPSGFEGNAQILISDEQIILYESVETITNPVPYTFNISDYGSVRGVVDAIVNTDSTFRNNVPGTNVPDYKPFTIKENGEDQYFLAPGVWSADLIIPFEEDTTSSLPYTVNIIPELYKYTLLKVYKDSNNFTINKSEKTGLFDSGTPLSFYDSISGQTYYHEVLSSELKTNSEDESLKDTYVLLRDSFKVNMIDPDVSRVSEPIWNNLSNSIVEIDVENSEVKFSGIAPSQIQTGTLFKFGDSKLYNVESFTQNINNFIVELGPSIGSDLRLETYEGYVKYTQESLKNKWSFLGNLDEKRLEIDTDYTIETGEVVLTESIQSLNRFRFNYMGIRDYAEEEGKEITCTCDFFSVLPVGSRVEVYLDFLNIDQFYLQKLTERNFTEIVVVPQITEIINQKGSGGGQGSDTSATSESTPTYEGGTVDLYYLLQDEYIKKQLYLRFYQWYKDRLRNFSAELQLILGFKFAHSNALGLDSSNNYSLNDQYVETEDYTLTSDDDLDQIQNGFSKFFPIGYNGTAPDYYDRFRDEYLSYNGVYCCNIKYSDAGTVKTVGIIKSVQPYWVRSDDLTYWVWKDDYVDQNLVGTYYVDVDSDERSFDPGTYSWLKRIDVGDSIKIDQFKSYHTIDLIEAPSGKNYEYIRFVSPFSEKGIKTYDLTTLRKYNSNTEKRDLPISFNEMLDNLPGDGYKIWVKRQGSEPFPMFDDGADLGAIAYGEPIPGQIENTHKIKKPFQFNLFALLFGPLAAASLEKTKQFVIEVKKDPESEWEVLFSNEDLESLIDLSKLTFKEERNIDDVLDALRYDFEKIFTVPIVPPYDVYDIRERNSYGYHRYFYMDLERRYDADSPSGYYDSIVLKAINREWWFRIRNGGEEDIIDDYGFSESNTYKNFYDDQNIYRFLLKEKQAWQTEELIIKDLYDYSDKLARAFEQGFLNQMNSRYQTYLAKPNGGDTDGISDILKNLIPAYRKQLSFLIDSQGPVEGILKPDGRNNEDSASSAIANSFSQTTEAKDLYQGFYNKNNQYVSINKKNNDVWKNNYVKWVLSLEEGVIFQKDAKEMADENSGVITVGLREHQALNIAPKINTIYQITSASYDVYSDSYGKVIKITSSIQSISNPDQVWEDISFTVECYKSITVNGVSTINVKTISEVVSEVNSYKFNNVNLYVSQNIFEFYENQILKNLINVSGQVINLVSGATLYISTVADHRDSDPRILYLYRNIEDRIYLQGEREIPALQIKYTGGYYTQSLDPIAIQIDSYTGSFYNYSYGTFFDDSFNKIFVIQGFPLVGGIIMSNDPVEFRFKLYDESSSSYITLQQLADDLNNFKYKGSLIFKASVSYSDPTESTGNLGITEEFIASNKSSNRNTMTPYLHIIENFDDMDVSLNQAQYQVYYDDAFVKKLDIYFDKIIINGSILSPQTEVDTTFTFSFQKSDGSFKTLEEFSDEINEFRYKRSTLFEASSIYPIDPGENLSTRYIVADNTARFIGFDQETQINADTYIDTFEVNESDDRNILNVKNASFCFPIYISNGNPAKRAIDGIPVSGSWENTSSVQVMNIRLIDGDDWTITFRDYEEGDYKSYSPPQDILDKINSSNPVITEAEWNRIRTVEDRPSVTILKEMVLTRHAVGNTENVYSINLRKYSTINELVQAINLARFDEEGNESASGNRQFYEASLIGSIDYEGALKSYELDASYSPIIKTFYVVMNNGNTVTKINQLIGWDITAKTFESGQSQTLSVQSQRYSPGDTYEFTVNSPERAYIDTLFNYPQGFRTDILAFDIYCWDEEDSSGDRYYQIKNDWIYFKSANVGYSESADLGQPDKTLGYGIPLPGSSHNLAPDNETLSQLIGRINDNTAVNKWFYANLKFTRDDRENPGYFEYNYFPNYYSDVPKSELDNFFLRDEAIMSVNPGSGYNFVSSSYTIDSIAKTISLSCDWEFSYDYTETYLLNLPSNDTLGELETVIDSDTAPQIASSIFESNVIGAYSSTSSTELLSTNGDVSLTAAYSNLKITGDIDAFQLRVRAISGANFDISDAYYSIPPSRDRITLKCRIKYNNTFSLIGYDISTSTAGQLADYISSLVDYPDDIFPNLFISDTLNSYYDNLAAERLISNTGIINSSTTWQASLSDIIGMQILNMKENGNVVVTATSIEAVTDKEFSANLPGDKILHNWIDDVLKGDYKSGFIHIELLPLKQQGVTYGTLEVIEKQLSEGNEPAHVYFGIMGDVRFIQISDYNLHTQLNYIKERLGKPWKNSQGIVVPDYYTPERYDQNNPYAIDIDNFLGYLRTTRYNQIRNSVINEALVSNKYFWLYMKFHKEFGCDQRIIALKDQIEKQGEDQSTLQQIL